MTRRNVGKIIQCGKISKNPPQISDEKENPSPITTTIRFFHHQLFNVYIFPIIFNLTGIKKNKSILYVFNTVIGSTSPSILKINSRQNWCSILNFTINIYEYLNFEKLMVFLL